MKKYIVQIVFLDRRGLVRIFKAKNSFDLEDQLKLELRNIRGVLGVEHVAFEYTTLKDFLKHGLLEGAWHEYKSPAKQDVENHALAQWKPISKYFDDKHDWALVQFVEHKSKFTCIPTVVEYKDGPFGKGWYAINAEENFGLFNYYNVQCSAVAFIEWTPWKNECR